MGQEYMADALAVATTLRAENIVTDVYYQNKGMKQKMKYANRLAVPYVAILGEDECAAKAVMLKNMETGEQQLVSVEELASYLNKN